MRLCRQAVQNACAVLEPLHLVRRRDEPVRNARIHHQDRPIVSPKRPARPQNLDRTGHPLRWDWQIGRVTPLERTGARAVDMYDVDGFLTGMAQMARASGGS